MAASSVRGETDAHPQAKGGRARSWTRSHGAAFLTVRRCRRGHPDGMLHRRLEPARQPGADRHRVLLSSGWRVDDGGQDPGRVHREPRIRADAGRDAVHQRPGRAVRVRGRLRRAGPPSLPNYIAVLAGDMLGVADDDLPPAHPLPGPASSVPRSTRERRPRCTPTPCKVLASRRTKGPLRGPAQPLGLLRGRTVPLRRARRPPRRPGGRRRKRQPTDHRHAHP